MTELSPLATCLGIDDHREALRGRPDLLRTVGRPVWNVEIRLFDAAGAEMPEGTPGEIMVRGPTVMRGYWGAGADETPLRDGWLATGDIGVFDPGGYLRLIDRKKDIIISGGENVASLEVETVLGDHPDVVECAVIGRPDAAWGERVHAVVVVRSGTTPPTASTLDAHCRATLAAYKCPKSWDIGTTPLPRTAIGKIDKKALRQ
jgi:long-chain acyl-CoA synthetase